MILPEGVPMGKIRSSDKEILPQLVYVIGQVVIDSAGNEHTLAHPFVDLVSLAHCLILSCLAPANPDFKTTATASPGLLEYDRRQTPPFGLPWTFQAVCQ